MNSRFILLHMLAGAVLLSACGKSADEADLAALQPQAMILPASDVTAAHIQALTPGFELPAVIEALQTAKIRPEVTATLVANHFKPGEMVEKGALLVELDDARYRVALSAAQAELQSAQANAIQAQSNWERAKKLMPKGYISALDHDRAKAAIGTSRATVAKAEAGIEQARLNLEHTMIYAPFSGRISKPGHAVGDFVSAITPSPLFELVQLDPIYASASVEQGRYSNFVLLRKRLESEGVKIPELELKLQLPGGGEYYHTGVFENWSHASSGSQGMITGRALFPNPDGLLLPGGNVILSGKTIETVDAIVVPQKAVFQDQQGHYVMVVDTDNVVRRKNIEVGIRAGIDWAIRSGLKEGDMVIVVGVQRLKPGTLVAIQSSP